MAKEKTCFACTACGYESSRWAGRCPGCGAWNTLEETIAAPIVKGAAEAEAQGKGVVAVNGELVDGPVIITAKNTVAEYERIHGVHC